MKALLDKNVIVLGAGMIGVCAALELQSRGAKVTLVDRKEPGCETSYGNAGVIARSSLIPINNPRLWTSMPKLLTNRTATLRYSFPFMLRNTGWALGFLSRARKGPCEETMSALDSLIQLSIGLHKRLLSDSGSLGRLSERGWIFLYRTKLGYQGSSFARAAFEKYDVETETLDRGALQDLEPMLKPIFEKALWIKDACSVDSPGSVVQAYAKLFTGRGGRIKKFSVKTVTKTDVGWHVSDTNGASLIADMVVVALGPWSRAFMERLGVSVTMGFERGYHMHYSGPQDVTNSELHRPIYDTAGGYVLTPMEQGLRLTTGVELADCDAPPNYEQLTLAEGLARQAIDLGERLQKTPWLGRRPTMPDSRPVIGETPGHKGLYLAFGHQHIGFSTGPGTARILVDLMEDTEPEIPAAPFSLSRFIR